MNISHKYKKLILAGCSLAILGGSSVMVNPEVIESFKNASTFVTGPRLLSFQAVEETSPSSGKPVHSFAGEIRTTNGVYKIYTEELPGKVPAHMNGGQAGPVDVSSLTPILTGISTLESRPLKNNNNDTIAMVVTSADGHKVYGVIEGLNADEYPINRDVRFASHQKQGNAENPMTVKPFRWDRNTPYVPVRKLSR